MALTNPLASETTSQAGGPGATSNRDSGRAASLGRGKSASVLALDRVPPNSQEAEMAVLGAMLLSPTEAGSEIRDRLSDNHFYYSAHQAIFREISALQDALQAVALVALVLGVGD